MDALNDLAKEMPVVFPAHPRTIKQIRNFKLTEMVCYEEDYLINPIKNKNQNVLASPLLSYLDFLNLLSHAKIVLTDSGGIQEETTILGILSSTLRNNTERLITIRERTNILVGNKPNEIVMAVLRLINNRITERRAPKYWDGRAAERITKILVEN